MQEYNLDAALASDDLVITSGGTTWPVTRASARDAAKWQGQLTAWVEANDADQEMEALDAMLELLARWVPGFDASPLPADVLISLGAWIIGGGSDDPPKDESTDI